MQWPYYSSYKKNSFITDKTVNFTTEEATKAQRGNRGIILLFL
jgi:hypothetical protein